MLKAIHRRQPCQLLWLWIRRFKNDWKVCRRNLYERGKIQNEATKSCRKLLMASGWEPWSSGDSCSKGHGFVSQYRILNGHYSHLFVVQMVIFVWKDENKQKRGRGWHIFKTFAGLCAILFDLKYSDRQTFLMGHSRHLFLFSSFQYTWQ